MISLDIAVTPVKGVNVVWQLFPFALIGVAGGLVGATVNATWKMLLRKGWLRPPNPRRQHWKAHVRVVLMLSLLTTAVAFWAPLVLEGACVNNAKLETGSGDGISSSVRRQDFRFNCAVNQTNEVAYVFFEGREKVIKALLEQGVPSGTAKAANPFAADNPELSTVALATGFFGFLVLMVLTFGTAIPSGIFMPTIFAGCCGGSLLGRAMIAWLTTARMPHLGVFALIGAVALLGGIQRSSVSLVVIILEGTGEVQFVLPIIVTTVMATWVGNSFNHGVYEMVLEAKKLPFLEVRPSSVRVVALVPDIFISSCVH